MVRHNNRGWEHALRVTRPALLLAPKSFLDDTRQNLERHGVIDAVARRDTLVIYDWLQTILPMQGISDWSAAAYAESHGYATWSAVDAAMQHRVACARLKSHWHYPGCGYTKSTGNCRHPEHVEACPVPQLPLRKGTLNQAAFGLYLFMRDVCDGDFVAFIDRRLEIANNAARGNATGAELRDALLEPLITVPGTSRKIWSMALADLLLVGKPEDPLWQRAGAAMRAIDSLVHFHLTRTGVLRRLKADHAYGPACYGPKGCSAVIEGLAARIDARAFDASYPAYFPRLVQFALWHFCAADGWNICNGNRIDDRGHCENRYCPSFRLCDRLSLNPD